MGPGLWRHLLAWFPVRGIATVSSSVLAQFVTLLAPLLAGTQADYPNQQGAAGWVGENVEAVFLSKSFPQTCMIYGGLPAARK